MSTHTARPAKPHLFRSSWIWGPGDEADHNVYRYFRRKLTLEAVGDLKLHLTAETRYRLLVNGQFVCDGPPPCSHHYQFYDTVPLKPYLREGENCIGVIVHYLGGRFADRPGFLAELCDEHGQRILGSDAQWRTRPGRAWRAQTYHFRMNIFDPYQEHFDARKAPAGWMLPEYDGADWDAASEIGPGLDTPPWSKLVPRDIPAMAHRTHLPRDIVAVEECLALMNRMRSEDLSITLSQPGNPVRYSRVEQPEALLSEAGQTSVTSSTEHLRDHTFDGLYEPTLLIDFGEIFDGYVELEVESAGGGRVDIGLCERLIDGHFNNAIEGQFAFRVELIDGPQTWRSFSWRAMRYVKLRFSGCYEPVRIKAVRLIESRYPFDEEAGRFHSSDERLNAIWRISRKTIDLCCHESIMDTPWREQAQWLGDVSAVTLGAIYACFGDTALPAKYLRQCAASQQPHGLIANMTNQVQREWGRELWTYSLWFIHGLWNHYQYTGDRAWVEAYEPVCREVIDAFARHLTDRGLVGEISGSAYVDWANVDNRGEVAAINALYYYALSLTQRMAEQLGHDEDAAADRARRRAIAAAFDEAFYDADRGVYIDCVVDGERSASVSEHANFAAIAFGLVDGERADAIAERLLVDRSVGHVVEAQPFFTMVVLQALDRIGRFDLAMQVVRDRWGGRFVDRGHQTCLEEWTANGSWRKGEFSPIMRTHSHAWSAHPAEFLIHNLLGLEIDEPGCRRLTLRPQRTDFDYDVQYPTPHGPLAVRWRGGRLDVAAPDGVDVRVDPQP